MKFDLIIEVFINLYMLQNMLILVKIDFSCIYFCTCENRQSLMPGN
jgi:hypothetical protein